METKSVLNCFNKLAVEGLAYVGGVAGALGGAASALHVIDGLAGGSLSSAGVAAAFTVAAASAITQGATVLYGTRVVFGYILGVPTTGPRGLRLS